MSKKLSKSLLKEIVKECLVELLFEGIDNDRLEESISRGPRRSQNLHEEVERVSKRPTARRSTPRPQESPLAVQAQQAIPELTNDPIMAEIFADTAKTTLVEQTSAEGRKHAPATAEAAAVADADDLGDLFSGASNWADIAFAGQKDS